MNKIQPRRERKGARSSVGTRRGRNNHCLGSSGAEAGDAHASGPIELTDDMLITVCSECERACCWQGEFMCDDARLAGTVDLTVGELRRNPRGENERYWRDHIEATR